MQSEDREPRHHTQNMQRRLQETIDHLRSDIDKVDEPRGVETAPQRANSDCF